MTVDNFGISSKNTSPHNGTQMMALYSKTATSPAGAMR